MINIDDLERMSADLGKDITERLDELGWGADTGLEFVLVLAQDDGEVETTLTVQSNTDNLSSSLVASMGAAQYISRECEERAIHYGKLN